MNQANKSQAYQLIIFDWDGTILDSEAHIVYCMGMAIVDENLERPSDREIRHIIGLSLEKAITTLIGEVPAERVNKIAANYRRHFFDSSHDASELFPAAATVIKKLHGQGYYLAVATGKSRRGLDLALASSGFDQYFHLSRCADETCSKPDPQMLQEILTDLDLQPDQAIMIGDTSYDIEMANNLKMDSIAVTYGMHDRAHLQSSEPTYWLDELAALPDLLSAIAK